MAILTFGDFEAEEDIAGPGNLGPGGTSEGTPIPKPLNEPEPDVDELISQGYREANDPINEEEAADSRVVQQGNEDVNGGVWNDITTGLKRSPLQIVGGLADLGNNIAESLHLPDLQQYGLDLVERMAPDQRPPSEDNYQPKGTVPFPFSKNIEVKSYTGGGIRSVTQFVGAFIPVLKATKATTATLGFFKNSKVWKAFFDASVAGAPVDAFGFDPNDPNAANMIAKVFENSEAAKVLEEYLGTDPNNSEAYNRFVNALNGVLIGAAFEGVFRAGGGAAKFIAKHVRKGRLDKSVAKELAKIAKLEEAAAVKPDDIAAETVEGKVVKPVAEGGADVAHSAPKSEADELELQLDDIKQKATSTSDADAQDLLFDQIEELSGKKVTDSKSLDKALDAIDSKIEKLRKSEQESADLRKAVAGGEEVTPGKPKLSPEDEAAEGLARVEEKLAQESANKYDWKMVGGKKVRKGADDYQAKSKKADDPAVRVDPEAIKRAVSRIIKGDFDSIVESFGETFPTNHAKVLVEDDAKAIMATIEKEIGPYMRDTPIPNDMVEQIATLRGVDASSINILDAATQDLAAKFTAARIYRTSLLDELTNVYQRVADANLPADILEMHRLATLFANADKMVVNAQTNVGRTLSAFKKAIGPGDVSFSKAADRAKEEAMVNILGGKRMNQRMARRMAKLMSEANSSKEALRMLERANRLMNKSTGQKWADAFLEMYINGLLSKPVTQIVNFGGNMSTIVMSVAERQGAEIAARVLRSNKGVVRGETKAMINGLGRGMIDGWKLAKKAWKTGEPSEGFKTDMYKPGERAFAADALGFADVPIISHLIDGLGAATRWPGKLLMSADEGFKAANYAMELHAQAFRKTTKRGLQGEEFAKAYNDIIQGGDPDVILGAMDFARYNTFTRDLGAGTRNGKIQSALSGDGFVGFMGRIFIPFFRTPVNILKFASHRTPFAAAVSKEVRAELAAGGARRQLALTKMAMGSSAMTGMMYLAHGGLITGAAPRDPVTRDAVQGNGWKPYSIRMPWGWVPYNRFDPIGILIGLSADFYQAGARLQAIEYETPEEEAEAWGKYWDAANVGMMSIYTQLKDRHYIAGLANVFDILDGDESSIKQALGQQFKNMLPPFSFYSSFRKGVAQTLDPVVRDTYGEDTATEAWNILANGIPGLQDDLFPKRDQMGQPILRMGSSDSMAFRTINNFLNPAKGTTRNNSVLLNEISRLEVAKTGPHRVRTISTGNAGDPDVPITGEMKDFFGIQYGKENQQLEAYVKTSGYKKLNPPRQKLELQRRLNQNWKKAMDKTRATFRDELDLKTDKAKIQQKKELEAEDIPDRQVPSAGNPDPETPYLKSLFPQR